jgi:hypothetical protein
MSTSDKAFTTTADEVREIYRKIYNSEHSHGDFLYSFATTLMYAGGEDFRLLMPAAIVLIRKYKLDEEKSDE